MTAQGFNAFSCRLMLDLSIFLLLAPRTYFHESLLSVCNQQQQSLFDFCSDTSIVPNLFSRLITTYILPLCIFRSLTDISPFFQVLHFILSTLARLHVYFMAAATSQVFILESLSFFCLSFNMIPVFLQYNPS